MAKVTETKEEVTEVTLTLNREEAEVVAALTGRVAGNNKAAEAAASVYRAVRDKVRPNEGRGVFKGLVFPKAIHFTPGAGIEPGIRYAPFTSSYLSYKI